MYDVRNYTIAGFKQIAVLDTLSYIIIVLLQERASFYSWGPADVPRAQGSADFCTLVAIFRDLVYPTFANLWQSCNIPVLLSIFFSVFFFLPHQVVSLVPLLGLFLYPFSPHAQPSQPSLVVLYAPKG